MGSRASPPRPAAAGALLALVLAAFFAPALLGGGDFVYRDTGRMHAPMKRWIAEELRAGRLPQWNPYSGLGTPVVAGAVDAVQHPLEAAFLVLPPAAAMKAWVLLSFALAAAGAYAWARTVGRSVAAASVAALAFALSGPLVSSSDNVQYLTTYAALPWIFAAAAVHAARGGPRALLGVALAGAACAAGGDPQAWAFATLLVPLHAVLAAPPGGRAAALRRGLAAAAAIAVASAPFILPVLAWLPHTGRAAGAAADATRWNLHPRRLAELVVPELFRGDPQDPLSPVFRAYAGDASTPVPWFLSVYLGSAVVALAALGAARSRPARLLVLGAAAFAWAALGHHAGFGALASRLPVLGSFRYWEKVAVWIPLLLAPAAAEGADALLLGEGARGLARGAAAGAAALLAAAGAGVLGALPPASGVAAAASANLASGAARAALVLALLAALAALVARGRLARAAPLLLAAIVALDLFGGNGGAYVLGPPEVPGRPPLAAAARAGVRVFAPFQVKEDRWPALGRLGSTREWSRRTLAASWNVPLHVGSDRDYVGLREARWARYREALGDGGRTARLGLFGFTHVVVPGSPDLAARVGVGLPAGVAASDPELPAWLVEVPHRPRAYLAREVTSATEGEAFAFAVAGGADGRTVVEGPVPAGYAPPTGDARVEGDAPGETVLRASADRPALLVLNDAAVPGWSASVDGRPVEIVRANGLVRGVWLEAGTHDVRFRYRTPGLCEGWAIALAGALALAGWAVARRRATRAT
jgi:hypothetical protein